MRKAGNRLRITAQLIDTGDGAHLWSERFDRTLEDVFAIQDEIARAVVENLRVRLLGDSSPTILKRQAPDLDAYNAYLKGLFYWNMLSPEGYAESRVCYEEAIGIDPRFAPAYAQLAIWYASHSFWGDMEPRDAFARAIELSTKALALDPDNPDAHATIGMGQAFIERNWEKGEESLRAAVRAAPNSASPWLNLGALLLAKREWTEAEEVIQRTQRLDPLSPTLMTWTASWLGYIGRSDESIAELRRQRSMHPEHWLPRQYLGEMLARRGDWAEAISELECALEMSGEAPIALSTLSLVHSLSGDAERGDRSFERLQRQAAERYVPPTFLAWNHMARGEGDEALSCVREALEGGDPWLSFHRIVVPEIVPSDPRVTALLEPELP